MVDIEKLIPPPEFPSREQWEISIADLARRSGKVPKIAAKALGLFDRFGAVKVGPDEVGFDNDEVAWDKVSELRTWRVSNLLTGQALEHEVDRIKGYLPPVPGRKWVVSKIVNLLLDLALAVTGDDARKLANKVDGTDESDEQRVVAEIAYRGTIRNKESRAGVIAAVILAAQPQVSQTICKWSEMKGIPVVEGVEHEDHFDNAMERGQAMRDRFDRLAATARRLRQQHSTPSVRR